MNTPYQTFLNECLLEFVKKILSKIATDQLSSDQTLYISYRTDNPQVILSPKVKDRYPEKITIVIQHQFDNLIVQDNGFSVKLSFDNVKETIYVPFNSLISFIDPNNGYSLNFKTQIITYRKLSDNLETPETEMYSGSSDKSNPKDNIIILDKFRKSNKPI